MGVTAPRLGSARDRHKALRLLQKLRSENAIGASVFNEEAYLNIFVTFKKKRKRAVAARRYTVTEGVTKTVTVGKA